MSRGRLPTLTPRKVTQALERAGFVLHRVRGSHRYFVHPDRPDRLVPIPYHARDIKRPLLRTIVKQAGLTEEESIDLL
jgi:predicted RNA binding protein YcfA (HicA-like mRNA interferase family)